MATMQDCITDCLDCHSVCLATIGHCLQKGGEHAEHAHIRLLQDCAQIADDETMVLCVETCRRCAKSCSEMASAERKAA